MQVRTPPARAQSTLLAAVPRLAVTAGLRLPMVAMVGNRALDDPGAFGVDDSDTTDAPVVGTDVGRVALTHWNLNDGTLEGLRCLDVPAFSVQYHPEAAAGPHDSAYLFDRFVKSMEQRLART